MNSNGLQNFVMKLSKLFLIAATALMALFALLTLFRLALGFWIYAAVEDWVTTRLGLDYYAAQLVTVISVLALNAVFPALAWYLVLGKKKAWGIGVFIAVPAIMFLLVSAVGNNICFDRRSGKPLCYYADTPNGRVWSRTPGYDPNSGTKFNLYTKEIMEREAADKRKTSEQQLKKKEESEDLLKRERQHRELEALTEKQTISSQEKTEQPVGQTRTQQPAQEEEELPAEQDANQNTQTEQEREVLEQELARKQQETERMRQQLMDQQRELEEERRQKQEDHARALVEQEQRRIEAEKQRAADERKKQAEKERSKAERDKAIVDLINIGVDIYKQRRRPK